MQAYYFAVRNSNYRNTALSIWEIEVDKGAKLPKAKQRRFNREESLEVKKQLDQLLRDGITIYESKKDMNI
jgi:type II secretory pathway component PulF